MGGGGRSCVADAGRIAAVAPKRLLKQKRNLRADAGTGSATESKPAVPDAAIWNWIELECLSTHYVRRTGAGVTGTPDADAGTGCSNREQTGRYGAGLNRA